MLWCGCETSRSKTTVEFFKIGQSSFGDDSQQSQLFGKQRLLAVLGKDFMECHIPLLFVEPPISPVLHFADKLWAHFLRQK